MPLNVLFHNPLVPTVIAILTLIFVLASLRLLSILPPYRPPPRNTARNAPTRILVVLGSGGHTAEMLAMLGRIDMARFSHRTYVVSTGDVFSADKARRFEESVEQQLAENMRTEAANRAMVEAEQPDGAPLIPSRVIKQRRAPPNGAQSRSPSSTNESHRINHCVLTLPRARRVHQSILTTPITSLYSLVFALRLLYSQEYPDIIITNGPGTAVILVLASIILRFFDARGANSAGKMRTIYVESWARVRTLSLSGKLLINVVDRFLVQWEVLEGCGGGRGEFRGVLV